MCDTTAMPTVIKDYMPTISNTEDHPPINIDSACKLARLQVIKGNLPWQIFYARQILPRSVDQYLSCIDDLIMINAAPSLSYHSLKQHDIKATQLYMKGKNYLNQ